MTKEEALQELTENGSHCAYDRASAEAICEPFGIKPHLYEVEANVTPKGLLVDGVEPGTVFERCGGWELAGQIASAIGADTTKAGQMMGRGFRFRAYLEAINAKLAT